MENQSDQKAVRHNEGKLRWSLVDFKSLEPMVRVLEFGSKKYSDDNWKKGLPEKEVCESIMRHLVAYMSGEINDPESGELHLAHIMSNAMFLIYQENRKSMREFPSVEKLQKIMGKRL